MTTRDGPLNLPIALRTADYRLRARLVELRMIVHRPSRQAYSSKTMTAVAENPELADTVPVNWLVL